MAFMSIADKVGVGVTAGLGAIAAVGFLGPFYAPYVAAKYVTAGVAGGILGSGVYSAITGGGGRGH